MKRLIKNILMIVIIIVAGIFTYFTLNYIKDNNVVSNMTNATDNAPSDIPEDNIDNAGDMDRPDGEETDTNVPDKPDSDSTDTNVPDKPDGDDTNTDVPDKPDNDSSISLDGSDMDNMEVNSIDYVYYISFGIESLVIVIFLIYLIMSRFNKKSLKETFKSSDKVIIYILSIIIFTSIITYLDIYLANNYFTNSSIDDINNSSDSSTSSASGEIEIDGTSEELSGEYSTSKEDVSVLLVKNSGNLTLTDSNINKEAGDSSNTENSEFYGVNAGVLVTSSSTATIKNTTITTNATGSNAVFSTGEDSKIYISDSIITTTGSSSARGLDATYGGYISADNVTITTSGGSCAALATDRGEGTVIASNSKLETNGSGSPVIYSTGSISISNTEGVANGSQLVVIEGKNSATVEDSTLTASGQGNRGDVDQAGVMIYQSMSGDADEGTGTFTSKNSTLEIQTSSDYYSTAPMFFITNTNAVINLEDTSLKFGSNILLSIKGTSEWGTSGSNGGNVEFEATDQELNGNIEVDDLSSLSLTLVDSSYTGTINSDNTSSDINLILDSDSEITLTGNSYINSLEDEDTSYSNINFNGYKLYVNGNSIN